MTPIVYTGPLAAVVIAATGQIAHRGVPLDVVDDVADALLEQADWSSLQQELNELEHQLAALERQDLVQLATAAGIPAGGTRPQIAKRIRDHAAAQTDAAGITNDAAAEAEKEQSDVAS